MKKTLRFSIVFALIAISVAISAFAATTTFRIEAYDEAANQYDMYVNVAMGEGGCVNTHCVKFTFNSDKLILTDTDYAPITELSTASDAPILPVEYKVGKKTYSYNFVGVTWTPTGNKTQAYIPAYTTDGAQFDASDLDLYTVSFKLADGITLSDITPDDFVIDYVYISDTNLGKFGLNEPTVSNPVTVANNAAHVKTESKLSVPAASTVYFVDGTSAYYAEATDVTVPEAAGLIVVNTGFTTQKIYKVAADATYTEVTALADGVLGADGAGIRTSGVQGIRFRSSVADAAVALTEDPDTYEIAEYGYIITAESTANALPVDYKLDMALVNSGKAKKGVAYNKADGTNITFAQDAERTIFTSVVTNIPKTADALQTKIASRPYYLLKTGEVVYGEITRRSIYEVANSIKTAGGEDYTANKAYIDEICAVVEATLANEVVIDVSSLYD